MLTVAATRSSSSIKRKATLARGRGRRVNRRQLAPLSSARAARRAGHHDAQHLAPLHGHHDAPLVIFLISASRMTTPSSSTRNRMPPRESMLSLLSVSLPSPSYGEDLRKRTARSDCFLLAPAQSEHRNEDGKR